MLVVKIALGVFSGGLLILLLLGWLSLATPRWDCEARGHRWVEYQSSGYWYCSEAQR